MGNCTSFTFHQWAVDLGQIHLHCSLLTSFFKDTGRPPVKHLTFLCLSLLNYEIGVLTSVQTLLWDSIKIIDLNPPVRINVSQFSQRTGGTDYFLSVVWFFILPSYLLSDISLRLSIPSPYILSTVLTENSPLPIENHSSYYGQLHLHEKPPPHPSPLPFLTVSCLSTFMDTLSKFFHIVFKDFLFLAHAYFFNTIFHCPLIGFLCSCQ